MKALTSKQKDILIKALELINKHYDEKEAVVRQFKCICHNHLPQQGQGYLNSINVFEIQDKTIADIRADKDEAIKTFNQLNKLNYEN